MRLRRLTTWIGILTVATLLAAPAAGALVHRYTFEGGNADDAVGGLDPSGTSGVVIDTADPLSPEGSYSALFGGSAGYIEFGSSAFSPSAFSVAMWVKPGTITGTLMALVSNKGGGNQSGFALNVDSFNTNDGALWVETVDAAESAADLAFSNTGQVQYDGTWQHLAYTIDRANGQARLYYEGADVTSADDDIWTDFDVTGPWRMGLYTDGQFRFDGRLDDVQIYDRILGPGAVRYLSDNPGSAIPEPVTTIGLLLGGAALTAYSRRRQRER